MHSTGQAGRALTWRSFVRVALVLLAGLGALIFNDALTAWLFALNTNWLFVVAVLVSVATGAALGGLMAFLWPLFVAIPVILGISVTLLRKQDS